MTKSKLYYHLMREVAGKVIALDAHGSMSDKGLMGAPTLNFMFASNLCKNAVVEQFGRMNRLRLDGRRTDGESMAYFGKVKPGDLPRSLSPHVSWWFVAYLICHGRLRVSNLVLGDVAMEEICGRDLGREDLDDVGAIDALTWLLGLEDKEPGLSTCQDVDLRLDYVDVRFFRSDRLSDLDKLLALRSKKYDIYLHKAPSAEFPALPTRARFLSTKEVYLHFIPGAVSNPGDLVPLLRHLIHACPCLEKLFVVFRPSQGFLRPATIHSLLNLRNQVFPRLPQETKATVRIVYGGSATRDEYEALFRDERVRREFAGESPWEFQSGGVHNHFYRHDENTLCRAMRWERGEGLDPWWVALHCVVR